MPHPLGRWAPPTLADALDLPADAVVRCPGCRRQVPAGLVRDLRPLPALGQDYGCDGCVSRMEREGRLTPRAYAEAAGAPAHIVAHLAGKDARRRDRLGR